MSTTIQDIEQMLSNGDFKYFSNLSENTVILPHTINEDQYNLKIEILDNGKFLLFSIAPFLYINEIVKQNQAYELLLLLNSIFKIGHFSCDHKRREIYLTHGIVLEDSSISERQLTSIVRSLIGIINSEKSVLRNVIELDLNLRTLEELLI